MIIVAALLSMMMAMGALVADLGLIYLERTRMLTALDLAAHSGAQLLPDDPGGAETVVDNKIAQNGLDPAAATVTVAADNRSVSIELVQAVQMGFARIFGFTSIDVRATTTAETLNLNEMKGILPLAFEIPAVWSAGSTLIWEYGNAGTGNPRIAALNFGGGLPPFDTDYMPNGYPKWVAIGASVNRLNGNHATLINSELNTRILADATATVLTYLRLSPRVVIVPVVTSVPNNFGSSPVTIEGFVTLFLQSAVNVGGGGGNYTLVTATVLRYNAEGIGSTTAPEYWTYATKVKQ